MEKYFENPNTISKEVLIIKWKKKINTVSVKSFEILQFARNICESGSFVNRYASLY